jgi:flagellar M-ring protein FliF
VRSNVPAPLPPPVPLPGTVPPAGQNAELKGPGSSRAAETTNYEVSKLVRHSIIPRGELSRLWVAVILDDDVQMEKGSDGVPVRKQRPRTPGELTKIQNLVSSAVGLDMERGDQLTVENVAFDAPIIDMTEPGVLPVATAPRLRWVVIGVGGAVGALVLIVVVSRVMSKKKVRPQLEQRAEAPVALPKTVEDMQKEIEAELDAPGTASHKLPGLAKRVGALASAQPEAAALLVRSWLTEDQH